MTKMATMPIYGKNPLNILLLNLSIRSLHMKFEFNLANGLGENYVLIYWWDSNMSDFAKRSKVNLDLWNLFIAIVSLG